MIYNIWYVCISKKLLEALLLAMKEICTLARFTTNVVWMNAKVTSEPSQSISRRI